MNKETFVSLHNHSSYSFSDALISVDKLVDIAKFHNSPAIAITEHSHAASMPVFIKKCEKEGIKWILGCEFYFQMDEFKATEKSSYHLLINVKNEIGYKNYLQLMYMSNIPAANGGGFYGRPRITEKMLFEHKEGLIVSSSCVQGPIAANILNGKKMDAYLIAEMFRDNLDDFYIEIMPHRLEIQLKVNKTLVEIGKRLGIPVITSLDTHLADTSYNEAYTCNGDLRRNKVSSDRTSNTMECITDWDLYPKTIEEIYDIYSKQDIPDHVVRETLKNTLEINEKINFTWKDRHFESPVFCEDAEKELKKILNENLIKMFRGRENIPQEYKERTRYEYDIIVSMGFSNYFLILNDAISFTKSNGIIVGPGRGSAGGSLLAYILGITRIDPIIYGLPFERFLNPARTNTAPDIDVDLEPRGREILINYLKEKWGDTSVIQVANHSELKIKAALKDAGKWLMIPFSDMNAITASIPSKGYDDDGDPIEMNLHEALKVSEVQSWKSKHPQLFDIAEKLEGSYRQFGIHAGAVCILPKPAQQIIPVMKKKTEKGADVMVSQWDKGMLEGVGIHKYDFLGLSTLEILSECEKLSGIKTADIPLNDQGTWKYFQEANNMLGIFQFMENKTVGVLRKVKPKNLNELADVNTLIRPGADLDTYIKNKAAKEITYKYDIPEVREELKNSYGAVIYQENIMNLVHKLAGFTLGEGDLVRRALEKNDSEKIEKYKEQFIQNCEHKEIAAELFDWIGANANYLFNKSHALVYSLIGYWCAFYKNNYPSAFLVANLNHPKDTQKKSASEYICEFICEAREMGINVSLPKMGVSAQKTSIINGYVTYGLEGIKGIAENSAKVLSTVTATNFDDFVKEAQSHKSAHILRGKDSFRTIINKRHILSLCKIGFFGDPGMAIDEYNIKFKEQEDVNVSFEEAVNDAVAFEWFSPLSKYLNNIDDIYRDTNIYKIIQIKTVKTGVSANGYPWTMLKGKTPEGDVTAFLSNGTVTKGDVIVAQYKKGRNDTLTITGFKLLD